MKLFLDDERLPRDVTWIDLPLGPWVVVRSYAEFTRLIEKDGLPDHISFDHDLGLEHYQAYEKACSVPVPAPPPYDSFKEKTGYHCARWLVDYCIDHGWLALPSYTIHSKNVIGEGNIEALFAAYTRNREQYREARS
jgi:hypothetical protein